MTLVVLMVGIAVYLSRPGIAIAAILLPFAVLDEGTPDVIPALRSLSTTLYGTASAASSRRATSCWCSPPWRRPPGSPRRPTAAGGCSGA